MSEEFNIKKHRGIRTATLGTDEKLAIVDGCEV